MKKAVSLLLVLVMAVSSFAITAAAAEPEEYRPCSVCKWNAKYIGDRNGTTTKYVTSCENDDYSHPHTVYTVWNLYQCLKGGCEHIDWYLFSEREVCLYD